MKKVILLLVVCTYVFVGCRKDPKVTPEMDRQVAVVFSARSISKSVLKSAGTSDENYIGKVLLFGADAQGSILEKYDPILNPSSPVQLAISRDVTMLYAIANPSTALETDAAAVSTVSALTALTGDFSNAPGRPFLMGGSASASSHTVNVELIRAVAKISITGQDDFQIVTATVEGTPDKGYAFSQSSLLIPGDANSVDYPTVNAVGNPEQPQQPAVLPALYVAENTATTPTEFTVTGEYRNKEATYTFSLRNAGGAIDIERNKHYLVTLKPGFNGVTVEFEVVEWDDENIDEYEIPEEDFDW
jgi:uncharacterized protein (UPF0333 family)